VAILRIIASTRRLSPSESVVLYFLISAKKPNLILRKFPESFLRFAVARCFGAGEKIRQRNVHGFGDLGERFERGHGVAVFDARQVTT